MLIKSILIHMQSNRYKWIPYKTQKQVADPINTHKVQLAHTEWLCLQDTKAGHRSSQHIKNGFAYKTLVTGLINTHKVCLQDPKAGRWSNLHTQYYDLLYKPRKLVTSQINTQKWFCQKQIAGQIINACSKHTHTHTHTHNSHTHTLTYSHTHSLKQITDSW